MPTQRITALSQINPTPRDVLFGNRDYYVRTDGSDLNDGSANTSTKAFLTIQRSINVCWTLDFNGFTVTIHVADGAYSGGAFVDHPFLGGTLFIVGNTTTPSNCVITAGTPFYASNFAIYNVGGFRLMGASDCIFVSAGAKIYLNGAMEYGQSSSSHFNANGGGQIFIQSNYVFLGGAPVHWWATSQGYILAAGLTIKGTGTFSVAFAYETTQGQATCYSDTFQCVATGTRYGVDTLALVFTNGAGANYLPGTVAGTTSNGGIYA